MQLLEKLWAVKGWNSLSWESAQFGNLCVESQDFISAVAEKIQVNDSYLQQFSSLVALSWFILEIGEKESSDISATHGLFSSYFNYFFPNLLGGNIPYFHVGCFSVSSTHRNLGCCTTNPWDDPAWKMAQKNGWKYWKQGGGKITLVLWSRTCQMCAQDHIFTLGQGLRAEMCPQPELSCKTSDFYSLRNASHHPHPLFEFWVSKFTVSTWLMLGFVANQFEAECQNINLFRANKHQFLGRCCL